MLFSVSVVPDLHSIEPISSAADGPCFGDAVGCAVVGAALVGTALVGGAVVGAVLVGEAVLGCDEGDAVGRSDETVGDEVGFDACVPLAIWIAVGQSRRYTEDLGGVLSQ